MMGMPTWEEFMVPVLRVLADGNTRARRELPPLVAAVIPLTREQLSVTLASGQLTFENRVGWALSFLVKVGALDRPTRGHYIVTEAGRMVLEQFPKGVSERDLIELGTDPDSPIQPYVATIRETADRPPAEIEPTVMTPQEQVEEGIGRIHTEVSRELLDRLQGAFFEQAVVELLLAMGYGGATGGGSVTQLSNDGGIDGVIDQDILGLSKVYIQAKRYSDGKPVQRPEVQGFAGAVHGRADSGVFITTSRFSNGAREFADITPTRLVLIDGARLAELMVRFGVGVQVRETYYAVEIDEDFFA